MKMFARSEKLGRERWIEEWTLSILIPVTKLQGCHARFIIIPSI